MATPPIAMGDRIEPLQRRPDEVSLMAFSAATWNMHRIHYDRDYARSEGHRDIVVQGSLQANWMLAAVTSWQPMGTVRSFSFRNVATAFIHEPATVSGVVDEVIHDQTGLSVTVSLSVEGPQ